MGDLYDADFGTAYYRSRDPYKNFKIRVRLEKASNVTIVPQRSIPGVGEGNNVELQTVHRDLPPKQEQEQEEYEFHWQEKLFSKREVEKYMNEANCLTVLEKKYHQDALLLNDVGRATRRLFSYVDHDSFTNRDEFVRRFTNLPTYETTMLEQKMDTIRHRRSAISRTDKKPVGKANMISASPSDEQQKNNRLVCPNAQTMYIMADLGPSDRPSSEEFEVVLCTIKIDSNNVLSIKPDFNKGRKSYNAGGGLGKGQELCQYRLEHASKALLRREQEKEFKMYREIYSRHSEFLAANVGTEFQMPGEDVLRLTIFGEIVSASCFEFDDLFVHWFVDLPNGWLTNGVQALSGTTQTCSTKTIGRDAVAHFSFPFELDILHTPSLIQHKQSDVMTQWPQLFIEVMSLGYWQRYRIEGYAYINLPCTPGTATHQVACWRPAGKSCATDLRRFFIGGTPELDDPTFIAVPSAFEGGHLSKYGFTTISTGSVTIKTSTILQSQSFQHNVDSKKRMTTILDKLGLSHKQTNIMSVLEAFQKAKHRMVAARENLKMDFIKTLTTFAHHDETDA